MATLTLAGVNRAINTRATRFAYEPGGWQSNRWTAYTSYSLIADANDGPVGITTYARGTVTGSRTALGFHFADNPEAGLPAAGSQYRIPVTPGEQITLSTYIRSSVAATWELKVKFATAAYTWSGPAVSSPLAVAANAWTRLSITVTAPAGVESMAALVSAPSTTLPVGATFDGTGLMVNEGAEPLPFFDGDTRSNTKYQYGWTGTPHASTSTMKAIVAPTAVTPRRSPVTTNRVRRKGWRYFATRLNGDGTETLLAPDLPLEKVSIEDVLSGHNSINGTLEPVYKSLLGPDGEPLLAEWSTAIYAENNGDIRGGGIITSSGFDGPSWAIEATGFTGYAMDTPYTGSGYKGIEVDPIDVMREIWEHIQSQRGGNIGLELDTTDTDGKVKIGTELRQVEFDTQSGPVSFEAGPYKLNSYTNHDLASDIDTLAGDTPFDYHEKHMWLDDETIRHFVEIGYPKIGRRREDLRFVYGVNIFDPVDLARDGSEYASGTMVLGAGEGASMIKSIKEPPSRPGNRLRRIAVVVDDTIKSKRAADNRADAENQWRARLDDMESVIVRDHRFARLGAAKVGDEIRIEGQGDWVGVDIWARILSISFQPENGSEAEYTIARSDKLLT